MADNEGYFPLFVAAQEGHLNVVQYLLDQGVGVNRGVQCCTVNNAGMTPLYVAALNCRLPVVQYLLEHGADKDQVKNDGTAHCPSQLRTVIWE